MKKSKIAIKLFVLSLSCLHNISSGQATYLSNPFDGKTKQTLFSKNLSIFLTKKTTDQRTKAERGYEYDRESILEFLSNPERLYYAKGIVGEIYADQIKKKLLKSIADNHNPNSNSPAKFYSVDLEELQKLIQFSIQNADRHEIEGNTISVFATITDDHFINEVSNGRSNLYVGTYNDIPTNRIRITANIKKMLEDKIESKQPGWLYNLGTIIDVSPAE